VTGAPARPACPTGPGRLARTAVRAHAAVRVEAGPGGGVRVTELRSDVPLVLRRTGGRPPRPAPWPPVQPAARPESAVPAGLAAPGLAVPPPPELPTVVVHLVSAAAGPLAGDQLRLDIGVAAGVRLVLRSAAATVALPGHGPGPSSMEVRAEVASGGALDFRPEPTVAAAGCRHRVTAEITLGEGAHLRFWEEVVLGRFGEVAGSVHTTLRADVRRASSSSPLLRQELALTPDAPGLAGPAVLGGARAVGSLLIAGPGPAGLGASATVTGGVAVLPLAGPGVLVTALADDAVTLRRRLEELSV
jgi:urease accessory protein